MTCIWFTCVIYRNILCLRLCLTLGPLICPKLLWKLKVWKLRMLYIHTIIEINVTDITRCLTVTRGYHIRDRLSMLYILINCVFQIKWEALWGALYWCVWWAWHWDTPVVPQTTPLCVRTWDQVTVPHLRPDLLLSLSLCLRRLTSLVKKSQVRLQAVEILLKQVVLNIITHFPGIALDEFSE